MAVSVVLAGLDDICTALPGARRLTYLDVSSCKIQSMAALSLVVADAFHTIQDKAMLEEEFHGAIPEVAAHVQVLQLRDNQSWEALQENSLLQVLDLAGNQVGAEGTAFSHRAVLN